MNRIDTRKSRLGKSERYLVTVEVALALGLGLNCTFGAHIKADSVLGTKQAQVTTQATTKQTTNDQAQTTATQNTTGQTQDTTK
ncbi:hypothetical protein, partial [Liquorilactobacillus satsumensis]